MMIITYNDNNDNKNKNDNCKERKVKYLNNLK